MQPERARGWLDTILPILREGGPIVSLVLLVLGGITIWYLMGYVDKLSGRNQALYERIITYVERQRDCP